MVFLWGHFDHDLWTGFAKGQRPESAANLRCNRSGGWKGVHISNLRGLPVQVLAKIIL
jgi:hypothetical protein